jgi:hypothetical protein
MTKVGSGRLCNRTFLPKGETLRAASGGRGELKRDATALFGQFHAGFAGKVRKFGSSTDTKVQSKVAKTKKRS